MTESVHFLSVGVFDTNDPELELAFDYAIEMANNEILAPDMISLSGFHLRIPEAVDLQMSLKLCRLLKVVFIR